MAFVCTILMLTIGNNCGILTSCHIHYIQNINIISVKDHASITKQERKARAWTQAELAESSGVSRDWIIALEQAKPSVELALTLRTLKALNLPLAINQPKQPTVEEINLDDILDQTKQRGNHAYDVSNFNFSLLQRHLRVDVNITPKALPRPPIRCGRVLSRRHSVRDD